MTHNEHEGEELHLGDPVEIVTDAFEAVGVHRGAVGVIVDDWADGSNDVEVSDQSSGKLVARVRAAADQIRFYSGEFTEREPRKAGILFGRGDDLGAPVGSPPSPVPSQFAGMPGNNTGLWPLGEQPPVGDEDPDEIPWELRDEPPSGPIFH